jgi:transcriptional regulator with XRE-family HTH domain
MPSVERTRDRAARRALDVSQLALARELTHSRRSAGVSQHHVARVAGLSQPRISRTERFAPPSPRVDELVAHADALGLRLVVKLFPIGSPVRDAGQLRLLRRLRDVVSPGYRWRSEVPVGPAGDMRAWDALIEGPVRFAVDAETRLFDIQELQRRTELKLRDSDVQFVILLVAGSRHNRMVLSEHREALRSTFPYDTAVILRALRRGMAPPGSGIVVL